MSTEINKKVILRLFNEGITEKKFEVFDELISEKFIKHGIPNAPGGISGFRTSIQQFLQAFPDIQVSIQQIIAEGEIVATRGFFQGTHQGNFMGVPATGRKVRVDYMDFWKLSDGKCTENWVQMDLHGIMQQIGSLETAL
jgi:steroid delta-isomerase-like uncharacterized protein